MDLRDALAGVLADALVDVVVVVDADAVADVDAAVVVVVAVVTSVALDAHSAVVSSSLRCQAVGVRLD